MPNDDDDIYIVELSHSVHKYYEQSDSEDDENYDVRYENAQDKIQDNRDGHNYSQELVLVVVMVMAVVMVMVVVKIMKQKFIYNFLFLFLLIHFNIQDPCMDLH